MNRIETDFKEIKDYEDIETYYKDLDNKINDLRFIAGEIAGDRVESQKYIVRANREIERLNNIIDKAINFLKNIGYDEEMGRIWNDMNDDECTDLLKILEGGKE